MAEGFVDPTLQGNERIKEAAKRDRQSKFGWLYDPTESGSGAGNTPPLLTKGYGSVAGCNRIPGCVRKQRTENGTSMIKRGEGRCIAAPAFSCASVGRLTFKYRVDKILEEGTVRTLAQAPCEP